MRDQHHTSAKHMNNPDKPKATHGGGNSPKMITDGVSLEKGYEVVSPKGESPTANAASINAKRRK